MRELEISAKNIKKPIYDARIRMGGINKQGQTLDFSNYYMRLDGKPFYAVCGEAHFSRIPEGFWEDELLKMKMGGLNIVSTYVFWIHHEGTEGQFDWSGNKNLRKFLLLCQKHELYVILRIGPFCHGEVRNGGFPDWLFGRPFDIRCNDPRYLEYTRKWFSEIGRQVKGLLFSDGGPVIGTQIENEHEHASSPWEMTTENSGEWTPSGTDGPAHMKRLKEIAMECGIVTPVYTATAWGGACAPTEDVFPLWGGYAFRPWIFYGDIREHPATTEYLFGDYHNNTAPDYYNFDPTYPKEDIPFACCEMGGGMSVFYKYRFQLPYESVAAMAAVKAAGGCNFLGYYMFHGGTNPRGKKIPYLNENALPKFSYDYQAAIGEFGQLRDSYKMLKLQHIFYEDFADSFCRTKTILSDECATQEPHDTDTLRYALRVGEDSSGYIFINNYQDHVETKDQRDFAITLHLDGEDLRVPARGSMNLLRDQFCILPFNFRLGGATLKYATAQLITKVGDTYFFFVPEGMRGEFALEGDGLTISASKARVTQEGNRSIVRTESDQTGIIRIDDASGNPIQICVLTRRDSLNFWKFTRNGQEKALICRAAVLPRDGSLTLEYSGVEEDAVKVFPATGKALEIQGKLYTPGLADGIFDRYDIKVGKKRIEIEYTDASTKNADREDSLKRPVVGSPITSTKVVNARATLKFEPKAFEGVRQLILNVDYIGDIGYAFIDGEMVHDNFCNGAPWEIGLVGLKERLLTSGMYLYVSPKKTGGFIKSDSAMAARFEIVDEQVAKINDIWATPVYQISLAL